jgi:hypothetical protein
MTRRWRRWRGSGRGWSGWGSSRSSNACLPGGGDRWRERCNYWCCDGVMRGCRVGIIVCLIYHKLRCRAK